jgi:hypothetical protein
MNNPIISYNKANKERRIKILKKYGATSLENLKKIVFPETKEVKCTKSELSGVLLNHPNVTLTVSFQKQVKVSDVYKEIMFSYNNSTPLTFSKSLVESLNKVLNGQERIATGFTTLKKDLSGRIYFTETTVELDKKSNSDNRMILISLNNLNWVKIDDTTYKLK